ncbi:hypothetical protein H6504_00100 [Candidatus Woesearchaeota archaeon]|nr:hypothetical protein [Candidatus Woesearchaeota archaeon]
MIKTRVLTGLTDMRIRDIEKFLEKIMHDSHDQKLVIHLARSKKKESMVNIAKMMVELKKFHFVEQRGEFGTIDEDQVRRLLGLIATARSTIGMSMNYDALYGAVNTVNNDFEALGGLLEHVSFHKVTGNLLLPQQSVVKTLLSLLEEQDELLYSMIKRLKRNGKKNMHALFDEYDALHHLLIEEQNLVSHGQLFISELSRYVELNLKHDLVMVQTTGNDLARDIETLDVPRFQDSLNLRFKRIITFWMDVYLSHFMSLYTVLMGAALYDVPLKEQKFYDGFERLRNQVEKNLDQVAHFND